MKEKGFIELLKSWYKIYGKSVVLSRAIPHFLDGLKPVQRRLIYVIHREGYTKKTVKSTAICADTSKYFHPHGEAPIYSALVKLAQKFHTRVSVIETQGNWGSSDGDPAAASRYTECRGGKGVLIYCDELRYFNVPMVINYAGSDEEPEFLPVRLPMLLFNGSQGIAVGYATSIPPFNPEEIFSYIKAKLERKSPLLEDYILGPDFPEGGDLLLFKSKHREVLETGRGGYWLRANYEIEELGDISIVHFSNTPYRHTRGSLVEEILKLIQDKAIPGLLAVSDLSDRRGVDLAIKVQTKLKDYTLKNLFAKSNLESFIPVNIVVIKEGKPQVVSVRQLIDDFIQFRIIASLRVITARLDDLRSRLQRLKINVSVREFSKEIIEVIKTSEEPLSTLRNFLFKVVPEQDILKDFFKAFYLTHEESLYVMSMPISRLRKTVNEDNLREIIELLEETSQLKMVREKEEVLKDFMIKDFETAYSLLGEDVVGRRTSIIKEEDQFQSGESVLVVYSGNLVSRFFLSDLQSQKKGGKGRRILKREGLDILGLLLLKSDKIECITSKGRFIRFDLEEVPFMDQEEVHYMGGQINLHEGESIVNSLDGDGDYIFMLTNFGNIKLSKRGDLGSRSRRLVSLKEGETLLRADYVNLKDHALLFNTKKALKIEISSVRISKLGSGSVKGISNDSEINAVGMVTGLDETKFIMIRDRGFGKIESMASYPFQKRGGKGLNIGWKERILVGIGHNIQNFICLLDDGRLIRTDLEKLRSTAKRTNKGVKLVDTGLSQILASI